MDKKIDVSVIIPVYNSQSHILRCIDSVIKQDFSGDLEVVVIDDCSTDNSLEIIRSLAVKDARIKVIEHSINRKISLARKTGLKNAVGKYIWFVDSDDWIEPGSIQKLFDYSENSQCDVLLFNVNRVYPDSNKKVKYYPLPKKASSKWDLIPFFRGALWRKFIKSTVISSSFKAFDKSYMTGEDYLCSLEVLVNAQKVILDGHCYYNYYVNSNSITQSNNTKVRMLKNEDIMINGVVSILNKYQIPADFKKQELMYLRDLFLLRVASNPSHIIVAEKKLVYNNIRILNRNLVENGLKRYTLECSSSTPSHP